MYSREKHLDDLLDHLQRVQLNCRILAERYLEERPLETEFFRVLMANSRIHDASKFHGIEWEYLHHGPDTPQEPLKLAIKQHQLTNPHHPEYWGGIINMPQVYVAEMVCDWLARGQEFGTDFRSWIEKVAMPRFGFNLLVAGDTTDWVWMFVDHLLPQKFA